MVGCHAKLFAQAPLHVSFSLRRESLRFPCRRSRKILLNTNLSLRLVPKKPVPESSAFTISVLPLSSSLAKPSRSPLKQDSFLLIVDNAKGPVLSHLFALKICKGSWLTPFHCIDLCYIGSESAGGGVAHRISNSSSIVASRNCPG
ncbi:hypothetical protein K440DRAFT_101775 [Wilcoxina mikolae CBS 423.85]|nr:hypothetical protein K440DRAFT_101775 [Wilcoxina mikolae CBS 423.85]